MTKRLLPELRPVRSRRLLGLSIVAALAASVITTGVAQAASEPLTSDEGQSRMSAVKLTQEQAQALLRANQQEQHMRPERARQVIESAGPVTTLDEGTDSATGVCSTLFLYGRDDGLYFWRQNIFPDFGTPWAGEIEISTDGIGSMVNPHPLTLADDENQNGDGIIQFMGLDPAGHTLEGWMLTTELYYCSTDLSGGELYAEWR